MHRLITFVTVGLLFAQGCTKRDEATPQATRSDTLPMMTAQNVQIALISNYGFMDVMFSRGDGQSFSGFYADTATLHRVGIGPLHGRDSIADLVRGAAIVVAHGFARISEGFSIEKRDVIDSGTYSIPSARPFGPTELIQQGRYKTRWTYGPMGEWFILSDSLIGQPRKK